MLVRADMIRQIGGFSPDILFAEDCDLPFSLIADHVHCLCKQTAYRDQENPVPSRFDLPAVGQSGGAVSGAATHVGEMAEDGCCYYRGMHA